MEYLLMEAIGWRRLEYILHNKNLLKEDHGNREAKKAVS
jgi:hypothetical protein